MVSKLDERLTTEYQLTLKQLADAFKARNYERDWKQIAQKWKHLKSVFYISMRNSLSTSSAPNIEWQFLDRMQKLLPNCPTTKLDLQEQQKNCISVKKEPEDTQKQSVKRNNQTLELQKSGRYSHPLVSQTGNDFSMEYDGDVEVIQYCCVPLCCHNSKQHPHLGFYRIPPSDYDSNYFCLLWKKWLQKSFSTWKINRNMINSSTRVCSLHFENSCFVPAPSEKSSAAQCLQLKPGAFPEIDFIYSNVVTAQERETGCIKRKYKKRNGHGHWSDEETFLLINLVEETKFFATYKGRLRPNVQFFEKIADAFEEKCFQRTWSQISSKWNTLKSTFYYNLQNSSLSGVSKLQWPFHNKMMKVLANCPKTKVFLEAQGGVVAFEEQLDLRGYDSNEELEDPAENAPITNATTEDEIAPIEELIGNAKEELDDATNDAVGDGNFVEVVLEETNATTENDKGIDVHEGTSEGRNALVENEEASNLIISKVLPIPLNVPVTISLEKSHVSGENKPIFERMSTTQKRKADSPELPTNIAKAKRIEYMESSIRAAVPNVSPDSVQRILETLEFLGVEEVHELSLVSEEDLLDVLKPVKARLLVKHWKAVNEPSIQQTPSYNFHNLQLNSSHSSNSDAYSDTTASPQSSGYNVDWEVEFKVPWENFDRSLIKACENQKRPERKSRLRMVRTLVDSILKVKKNPKRKSLQKIAFKVIAEYPESFKDVVNGTCIGGGVESLTRQLQNRIENLIRPCRSGKSYYGSKVTTEFNFERFTPKRKPGKDEYGCVNWAPAIANEEELKDKQTFLLSEHIKTVRDNEKVLSFMKNTFSLQRRDINDKLEISKLHQLWPFLFQEDCLFQHYESLIGEDGAKAIFTSNIMTGCFDVYKALRRLDNSRVAVIIGSIEEESRNLQNEKSISYGVIRLLTSYFRERHEDIYRCFRDFTSVPDILSKNAIPKHPFIIVKGATLASAEKFFVVIEDKAVCETTSFFAAVAYMFCCFYVFSIQYPTTAEATFEYMQRYYAEINPSGTRSVKRNRYNVHPKVMQLTREVMAYQESRSAEP